MSFAINHQRRSAADNYVLALSEGRIRKIDWNAQEGSLVLEAKLIDYFYKSIKKTDCVSLHRMAQTTKVAFVANIGKEFPWLNELASREFMMHGADDMI